MPRRKASTGKAEPTRRSARNEIRKQAKKNPLNVKVEEWLTQQQDVNSGYDEIPEHLDSEEEELIEDDTPVEEMQESLKNLRKLKSKTRTVLLECEWKGCGFESADDRTYFAHIEMHCNELEIFENDMYCCDWDLCGYRHSELRSVRRHIYFHGYHSRVKNADENLRTIVNFPSCGNDSRNRNTIPDINGNYECQWQDCGKHFESIQMYLDHIRGEHVERQKLFQWGDSPGLVHCHWMQCTKEFKLVYRLHEHLRFHTHEKLIGCNHCGSMFASNTKFYDHCKRQIINNTQEYQCTQCLKYFSSKRILRDHLKMHVYYHKCSLCDMTCFSPAALIQHIRCRHVTEKPFKCNHCSFSGIFKRDLELHMMKHDKSRTYKCEEIGCNFACSSPVGLKLHDSRVHFHGQKVYSCHICSNRYSLGKLLSIHLKKMHGVRRPSGHSRFIYRQAEDGYYRVLTSRVESLEVTKKIAQPSNKTDGTTYEVLGVQIEAEKLNVTVTFEEKRPSPPEKETPTATPTPPLSPPSPPSSPSPSPQPAEPDIAYLIEAENNNPKSINDFTMMKRYFKLQKDNVIITVDDTDHDGNVLNSKILAHN